MELAEEEGEATLRIGHDQVLMGAHEGDGVYEDTKLLGTHGQRIEVELTDGRVRAEQVMTAKRASSDHHRVAGEHEARLGHAVQAEQESDLAGYV